MIFFFFSLSLDEWTPQLPMDFDHTYTQLVSLSANINQLNEEHLNEKLSSKKDIIIESFGGLQLKNMIQLCLTNDNATKYIY